MEVIGKIQVVGWVVILILLSVAKHFDPPRPPATATDALGMGVVAVMLVAAAVGALIWLTEALAR